MLVCAAAALGSVMALAWRVQQTSGNSGWVDVSWTFGVGGVAFLAALAPLRQDLWPAWRQIVVAALVAAWSLRLGFHIVARTRSSGDDPRYSQMAAQWGMDASNCMFWFLQKQAAVGVVLVMSAVLAAQNPNPAARISGYRRNARTSSSGYGRILIGYAAPRFQGQERRPECSVQCRVMAMVTASNLFFRVACLARLPRHRHRRLRIQSVGLARPDCADVHVLGVGPCFRHSAAWRTTCCARAAMHFATINGALGRSCRFHSCGARPLIGVPR